MRLSPVCAVNGALIVSRRKSSKEEKIVGGFTLPSQRNNEPNEAKLVHISVTLSAAFFASRAVNHRRNVCNNKTKVALLR
jgi:co-chaperonin GroES (HSP10)